MGNKTLEINQLLLRNDTAAKWTSINPILGKGELGIEIDTFKFKIGNGLTSWTTLEYANSKDATSANKLANARNIKISGDATGSTLFDGSADSTINIVLANSGATAGSYNNITVNSKGLITSIRTLTEADIPSLSLNKISGVGTAASKNIGSSSGDIPILDSNGKLDDSVLPSLAISDTFEVSTQSAMLALIAQKGDIAIRTDLNQTYILKDTPASTLSNWIQLRTPTGSVSSINGKTGAVTLTTSNITEGSNLYFTTTRFNSNFATKSVTGLSDGSKVVLTDDTVTINCGNA